MVTPCVCFPARIFSIIFGKNSCPPFAKVVRIYLNIPQTKIIIITFRTNIKSISTWSLSNHQRSNNFLNIRSVVITTYYEGLSLLMRGCMHCECRIPVQCEASTEWERSGKVRNRPGYLNALWRNRESNQMRALVTGDTNDALKRH